MMNAIRVAIACCIAAASARADSNPDAWTNAPLGIAIRKCSYDAHGVDVRFDTDLEPPYLVGVYRSEEIGLGRRFPVAEVVTSSKLARVPVKTMDATLFVQVMTSGAEKHSRRTISQTEYQDFVDRIKGSPVLTNHNAGTTWEYVRDDPAMELVSDNTWLGFRQSQLKDVTFSFSGRTNITEIVTTKPYPWVTLDSALYEFSDMPSVWTSPYYDWSNRKSAKYTNGTVRAEFSDGQDAQSGELYGIACYLRSPNHANWQFVHTNSVNGHVFVSVHRAYNPRTQYGPCTPYNVYHKSDPVTFSSSVTNADVSVGTGYRVLFFCDRNEVMAQRAYSARTNMSDEVIIERGFKSLSTHDGYRLTKDFDGRLYFQADTNAAPDRIHWEGIR